MAVLTLRNWLQSGQWKTVYMPPGLCDTYDPTIQSFIPGSWRKEDNQNCLIQLQTLQHGNNPSVVAEKIREEFKEYFSLEGVVNWKWECCMNQNKTKTRFYCLNTNLHERYQRCIYNYCKHLR